MRDHILNKSISYGVYFLLSRIKAELPGTVPAVIAIAIPPR